MPFVGELPENVMVAISGGFENCRESLFLNEILGSLEKLGQLTRFRGFSANMNICLQSLV